VNSNFQRFVVQQISTQQIQQEAQPLNRITRCFMSFFIHKSTKSLPIYFHKRLRTWHRINPFSPVLILNDLGWP